MAGFDIKSVFPATYFCLWHCPFSRFLSDEPKLMPELVLALSLPYRQYPFLLRLSELSSVDSYSLHTRRCEELITIDRWTRTDDLYVTWWNHVLLIVLNIWAPTFKPTLGTIARLFLSVSIDHTGNSGSFSLVWIVIAIYICDRLSHPVSKEEHNHRILGHCISRHTL